MPEPVVKERLEELRAEWERLLELRVRTTPPAQPFHALLRDIPALFSVAEVAARLVEDDLFDALHPLRVALEELGKEEK